MSGDFKQALLESPVVIELGDRAGVGLAGNLLAQLGARVILVERPEIALRDKWRCRAVCAAGKESIVLDRGNSRDKEILQELVNSADVLLLSSDVTEEDRKLWDAPRPRNLVLCDVTAFGHSGPLAGIPLSEGLVEAMAATIETTGPADGDPSAIGTPILEIQAAMFAAAGVVAALRVVRQQGQGQRIDVALFDIGVTGLVNFFPLYLTKKAATRSGNRHPLYLPWGTYRAKDGWILLCAGTDDHWCRVCDVIGKPQLAHDSRFATSTARLSHSNVIDEIVNQWTGDRTIEQCEASLRRAGIACGQIVGVENLADQPNLRHRNSIRQILDPQSGKEWRVSASPLRGDPVGGINPVSIPQRDADRNAILESRQIDLSSCGLVDGDPPLPHPALKGIRVVEIGHYTVVPMASRILGSLGADVIKVEPPTGDVTRRAAPLREDGLAYVYALSNTDKRGVILDLRKKEDCEDLHRILANADILLENLKPGSLAKLGFGSESLRKQHPHLIYCAVNGFGTDSVYPGRPALDTIIQAMSGLMDLTVLNGIPTKAGISISDMLGGEFALLAVLAALEYRDRTGRAVHFDISMHDASVWATQLEWNGCGNKQSRINLRRASDGLVAVDLDGTARFDWKLAPEATRAELVGDPELSFKAAPVLRVDEVFAHPQVAARELVLDRPTSDGDSWPVFVPPIKLLSTPARVLSTMPRLGFNAASIRAGLLAEAQRATMTYEISGQLGQASTGVGRVPIRPELK